jgi:hypothetical protein
MRRTLADLSFEPPEPSRYAIVGSSARQYFWQAKEPQLTRTAVVAIIDDDHFVREALTSYVRSLVLRISQMFHLGSARYCRPGDPHADELIQVTESEH